MLRSEQPIYERLLAAADRVYAECAYHPCPPPGPIFTPRACTCYSRTPEYLAFQNWESRHCDICGGVDKCKAHCEGTQYRLL